MKYRLFGSCLLLVGLGGLCACSLLKAVSSPEPTVLGKPVSEVKLSLSKGETAFLDHITSDRATLEEFLHLGPGAPFYLSYFFDKPLYRVIQKRLLLLSFEQGEEPWALFAGSKLYRLYLLDKQYPQAQSITQTLLDRGYRDAELLYHHSKALYWQQSYLPLLEVLSELQQCKTFSTLSSFQQQELALFKTIALFSLEEASFPEALTQFFHVAEHNSLLLRLESFVDLHPQFTQRLTPNEITFMDFHFSYAKGHYRTALLSFYSLSDYSFLFHPLTLRRLSQVYQNNEAANSGYELFTILKNLWQKKSGEELSSLALYLDLYQSYLLPPQRALSVLIEILARENPSFDSQKKENFSPQEQGLCEVVGRLFSRYTHVAQPSFFLEKTVFPAHFSLRNQPCEVARSAIDRFITLSVGQKNWQLLDQLLTQFTAVLLPYQVLRLAAIFFLLEQEGLYRYSQGAQLEKILQENQWINAPGNSHFVLNYHSFVLERFTPWSWLSQKEKVSQGYSLQPLFNSSFPPPLPGGKAMFDDLLCGFLDYALPQATFSFLYPYAESEDLDIELLLQVLAYLHRHGAYPQAVLLAMEVAERPDFSFLENSSSLFPLFYRAYIEHFSQLYDMEPSLLFALIRRESRFSPQARSSAGALGLMQIRFSTAQDIIQRTSNLASVEELELFDPVVNLNLGGRYIQLLRRGDYVDNDSHMLLAYNAGYGNLRIWKERELDLPLLLWLETIPFRESRLYTQSVIATSFFYQWILQRDFSPLEEAFFSFSLTR